MPETIPAIQSENKFDKLKKFLELIRFSHTIFALPFALLASWWAWIVPLPSSATDASLQQTIQLRWIEALGILACMVFARSFAMAFNRLVDAKWDGLNPRTANRHLPAKLLGVSEVVGFTVGCAVLFIASTLLFLPSRLPLLLSVPVLVFLAGYSLGKRFTWLVHLWLGTALALAPICAWIALRGEVVQFAPGDILPAVYLGGWYFFGSADSTSSTPAKMPVLTSGKDCRAFPRDLEFAERYESRGFCTS